MKIRFEIGEGIIETLDDLMTIIQEIPAPSKLSIRKQRMLYRRMKRLLEEAQPTSQYCATAATTLFQDTSVALRKRNSL